MRPLLIGLVIVIGFAPSPVGLAQTPAPQAQKVQLTFEPGGLVTLVTNGASIREVLNEWGAKGGTKFNGAERLAGPPLTLQFEHRPEAEVMGSLLRTASGIVIAPNTDNPAAASTISAVFIVATSNATMAGGYTPAPTYSQPQPQMSTAGNPDQEIPPAGPGRGNEPPPAPAAAPAAPRQYGGVAVQVVPVTVPTATVPPAGTNPPTTTPPPTTTGGRGGGGGGR